MKKIVGTIFAFFMFGMMAQAQDVVPPQVNPNRVYLFQLVVILTHATDNQSALYFTSIDRFDDQEYCQKRMYKSASKFGANIMHMRRMPLKSVSFFGNCQLLGAAQDMMFPLEFPKDKPDDEGKVMPQ